MSARDADKLVDLLENMIECKVRQMETREDGEYIELDKAKKKLSTFFEVIK